VVLPFLSRTEESIERRSKDRQLHKKLMGKRGGGWRRGRGFFYEEEEGDHGQAKDGHERTCPSPRNIANSLGLWPRIGEQNRYSVPAAMSQRLDSHKPEICFSGLWETPHVPGVSSAIRPKVFDVFSVTNNVLHPDKIFHQDFLREYSPRKSVFHVAPLSVDFSHDCSTLFALTRTTLILFRTASPFGPRLGP